MRKGLQIVAQRLENYVCLPMKHHVDTNGSKKTVKYQWQVKNQWCQLTVKILSLLLD